MKKTLFLCKITAVFFLLFFPHFNKANAACPSGTNCLPFTSGYCCGIGIYNFTFNTINNTTNDGADGYMDYSCTDQTTVTEGNSYAVSIETGSNFTENVFIWIDYNNDSTFDATEKVFSSNSVMQYHAGAIIIASNAVKNKLIRLRVGSEYSGMGNFDPCDTITYGQFEDYAITIIANTQPPQADFTSDVTTSCNGYIQFNDKSLYAPTSWLWNFGDGKTSTDQNPLHVYTSPGLYSVKLIATNTFGKDSITKTNFINITSISEARGASCYPQTTSNCCGIGITRVTFNTIDNLTNDGSDGYMDYSCTLKTSVTANQKYLLTILTGTTYNERVVVWVDFNNDGDFEDTNEKIFEDSLLNIHSDSIYIPNINVIFNKPLRMRVGSDYSGMPLLQPCIDVTYGQFEDYSVTIIPDTIPPVTKFIADANLTCNGIVKFTDQTQNAPDSWKWDFGDGDTDTIQNPTHTYTVSGNYTVTLITTNPFGSDTLVKTSYITVDIGGGPKAPSCTSPTNNGTLGFGITYFSFGNIAFTSANSSEGYKDNTCTQGTNINEGKSYLLSVTVDKPTTHHVRVWIDYNNDASFDTSSELVVSVNSVLNISENINIPTGKILNTPLRLRVSADWSGSTEPLPCSTLQYGQAEDYSIVILPNTDPPVAAFSVSDSITCDGTVTFTDETQNIPTSWFWNFGDGKTDTTQNPSHNYSVDGNYTITFIAANSFGSDTLVKNNFIQVKKDSVPVSPSCSPATLGYCCGYGIYNVTLNTINNTTTGGVEGYRDFSCPLRTNLTEGKTYNLSVQTGTSNPQDTRAWIDYNNDGAFDNTTERILFANNKYNPSANFTVPGATPLNSPLRLRVTSDFAGSNPSSCSDLSNGQAEDYTVVIRENTAPPIAYFASNKTLSCDGVISFTDSIINVANTIIWDFGDGKTDTINNPSHTYTKDGLYDVTLIVSNNYGADTVKKTGFITVAQYVCDTILIPSSGSDTVIACGGKLFDPGGATANYPNSSNSYRTIISPGADSLTITFQYFTLSSGDYLYIYDGPSTASSLIGVYTGTSLPNGGSINSSGDALTFRFYSNGFTTNVGFEAMLVSNYSGSAIPTAGLTASDTNPSLGSIVQFSDNSTGNISSWFWDFRDGNTSSLINPDNQFITSGTFNVMLVVTNCIDESDTAYLSIIVQDPPNIRIKPKSFNVTLITGDSITKPLYISNIGNGTLNYGITAKNFTGAAGGNLFEDGFEDGTYNKWQTGTGAYTREVTNTTAAVGDNSFKLTGGSFKYYDGIFQTFQPDTAKYIGFYVNSSSTSTYNCVVSIGDSNVTSNYGFIFFYASIGGLFNMSNAPDVSYVANKWYHIECKNINYGTQTFDYYVDDVLIQASTYFNTFSSNVSEVHLFGYSNSISYFDEIVIGGGSLSASKWLSYIPDNGSAQAVSEDTINVDFNSKGLQGGKYTADLIISANDPDTTEFAVPCTLNVVGVPEIVLSDSALDLGSIMIGANKKDTITISNTGTDSLRITNITSSDTVFTPSITNFVLAPFKSKELVVTFSPTSIKSYSANMTIFNNDSDTILKLTGIGIGAPAISVDPTSFNVILASGDSTTEPLKIFNNGSSQLNYTVELFKKVNYDSSSQLYYLNKGDSTIHDFYTVSKSDSIWIYVTINGDFDGTNEYADLYIENTFYQKIDDFSTPNGIDISDTFALDGASMATWLADGMLSIKVKNSVTVNPFVGTEYHIVRVITKGGGWLSTSKTSGIAAISSMDIMDVDFNAKGLADGTYTSEIKITSNDPVNSFLIVPCTLSVVKYPVANFDFSVSNLCNGAVTFTDQSSNSPTTYIWDFGDGVKSSSKNPSHTFSASGTYTVELKACNGYGCDTLTETISISMGNPPTTANCTPVTLSTCCNTGILNVNIGDINHNSDGAEEGYMDFTCSGRTVLAIGKTYLINIQTSTSNLENVKVWIDYNNDGSFNTGNEEVFSSNSTQIFHTGSITIPTTPVQSIPLRMRVIAAGDWVSTPTPCLDLTDGQAEDYTVVVVPDSTAPVASFGVTYLDYCQGIVQFVDSSQYEPKTWYWNFGDGSGTSTLQNPYYSYSLPGTYPVSLNVTNDFGSDTYTKNVKIDKVIADFNAPDFTEINKPVQFTDLSQNATKWDWNFDDGYSATVQNPLHIFTSISTFYVTLTASNISCSGKITKDILIVMTGNDEISTNEFLSIYPNPTNDKINLTYKFNSIKNLRISISNILGEQLILEDINTSGIFVKEFDLSGYSSGIYHILISDGNKSFSKKVILE